MNHCHLEVVEDFVHLWFECRWREAGLWYDLLFNLSAWWDSAFWLPVQPWWRTRLEHYYWKCSNTGLSQDGCRKGFRIPVVRIMLLQKCFGGGNQIKKKKPQETRGTVIRYLTKQLIPPQFHSRTTNYGFLQRKYCSYFARLVCTFFEKKKKGFPKG